MLTAQIGVSSGFPARLQLGPLLVLLLLTFEPMAHGQLTSPCPSIFNYRWDPITNQVFGFIQLYNLRIGQVVRLNVALSIGFNVPRNNVGSITLIKSKEQTFRDINNKLPAQYRVNLPFRNAFPNLLAIYVNGQPVCYGQKATGKVVTTINLDHTLVTQLQTPPVQQTPRPVVYTPTVQIRPQPQPQPVFVQTRLQSPQLSLPTIQTIPPTIQPRPPIIQTIPPTIQPRAPLIQTVPPTFQPRPPIIQTVPPTVQPRPPVIQTIPPTFPPSPPTTQPRQRPVTRKQVVQTPRPKPKSNDVCGKPAAVYSKLSINGIHSPKGQFPWAVPIFDTRSTTKPRYICGSTILNKNHLVTAAHCMFDETRKFRPADLLTTPGMYNIDNFFENDIQERDVASIIVHPDYDDNGMTENDIALLVLQQAIVYNDLVRPICLWNGNDNFEDLVGKQGFVSGWGLTENGSAKKPSYVNAQVVSNKQCRRKMGTTFSPDKRTFCGDGQGAVPCTGDSGSGLVLRQNSQFFIRGIVSRGQLDPFTLLCDATAYVLYTDITQYRPWLLKEMEI